MYIHSSIFEGLLSSREDYVTNGGDDDSGTAGLTEPTLGCAIQTNAPFNITERDTSVHIPVSEIGNSLTIFASGLMYAYANIQCTIQYSTVL